MKTHAITSALLSCALLLPLAACSSSDTSGGTATPAAAAPDSSFIGTQVRKGIEQAKRKLASKDISIGSIRVNGSGHAQDHTRPKAAITPQGTLVIAGKPVDATPQQHALLVDYRQQIIGIAETGMDIGARGADVGVSAARQAIFGAFSGKSDKEIEASIKPQTDAIQAAALQLCKRMPGLLASQQQLAAAMPAFRPYATMTQKDVDDCGKDMQDSHGKKGFAVFSD
jgi:hypothetical protein